MRSAIGSMYVSQSVSCIVPAHNEAPTIGVVLGVLTRSPLIGEVIVVDDGSTDETGSIVTTLYPSVHIIRLKRNEGKANAFLRGSQAAKYPILFFCDADLLEFSEEHIADLVRPIFSGNVRLVCGAQEYMNPFAHDQWYRRLFRPKKTKLTIQPESRKNEFLLGLGGEKVLFKDDFLRIPNLADSGYGVEQRIIEYFRQNNLPISYYILHGVTHRHKIQKWGLVEGLRKDAWAYGVLLGQFFRRSANDGLS